MHACGAGDHVRQNLFEVGSAREPTDFVQRLLGRDSLLRLDAGWAPDSRQFLSSLEASLSD